ncbi:MAG TPA: hypothetical protein VD772_09235, partial [Anseongella sp.]|nr:hypothetical protein [Anseongella sp.]
MKGSAKSFPGYPIDGARLVYTVTRTSHFQPLQRFQRHIYPPQPPLQIAAGILETDSEGKFDIAFLAAARDTSGIYSYRVSAHITDQNGETRDGSTAISIGNRQLQISADFGTEIYTGNLSGYKVSARNLNGEVQQADARLRIYALSPPEHPLRERLWDMPDKFIMSRESYKEAFPYDAYRDEDDYRNWEPGKECLEMEFHLDSVETIRLDGLKKCSSGYYMAEIRVVTAAGETATQQYYFNLLSE